MVTNEIRRTRVKYEISQSDNLNWFLADFITEFKDTIDNNIEINEEKLRDTYGVIELVKQKLRIKYLKELQKTERKQLEMRFYE